MSARLPAERSDRLTTLAELIRHEVAQAEADFASAVEHAIAAGERLTKAKSLLRHGEWLPWVEKHFPGSERTARQYMRLAANRQHVADLPTVREAVALLTQPNAEPETADPLDGPLITREQADRFTGSAAAVIACEKAWARAERMRGSNDHLAAAREWIAAAEAGRAVIREVGRGLLGDAVDTLGPLGTALARAGAAALACADHYEPWDDRHDECHAEFGAALDALDGFRVGMVADRLEGGQP